MGPCWDIYTPVERPHFYVDAAFQVIAVPGRCGQIIRLKQPTNATFANSLVERLVLVDPVSQYVASVTYDWMTKLVYYASKDYDSTTIRLQAVDAVTLFPVGQTYVFSMGEADPVLTIGHAMNRTVTYLYIYGSGGTYIMRMTLGPNGALQNVTAYANLNSSFGTQVETALYIDPYLYFGTYEPNAILARVHGKNAFCTQLCPKHGFCERERCRCGPGFEAKVDSFGIIIRCEGALLGSYEHVLFITEQSSIALGVLFGIALLVAIAGWYMWWRARKTAYQAL